jgi:hypothetical protein
MNWQVRCSSWGGVAAVFVVAFCTWSLEASAQEAPEGPAEAATEVLEDMPAVDEAPEDVEAAFSAEELQALVAPIALYPDLVLVLTLQASLAPLDVVQAQRFLDQYADDPSLTPDQDWDESVIGLLNYPTVVQKMNDDLEWTETLGTAVVTQLEGIQDAIQEIRGFMRAIGALESNDQMTVIAEADIIRIEPADENAVFIPQYDPEALLAALYSTDVPAAPAEASVSDEEAPVASEEAIETEGVVEAEETGEIAGSETTGEPEPAPTVEAVPAAAPAYYPAVAPPPVTYSDPSPSWLGTAATFAGGAVVGGLVGWAIADDDDDDDNGDIDIDFDGDGDRWARGDVNIEDNTIVVNRGDRGDLDDLQQRAQGERLEREARERAQREDAKQRLERRYAENQPRRTAATAGREGNLSGLATSGRRHPAAAARESPGGRQLAARAEQARVKADPGRREAAGSRPTRSGKAVRAGDRKQQQVASAFGGGKSARQAKRDSDRGLKSRSRANTEVKRKRDGGGGVFAQHGGGGRQAHASRGDRGKKSRRGRR